MAPQPIVLQATLTDEFVDDFSQGASMWTSWSIGLVTAALGMILLVQMAKLLFNRL